MIYNNIYGFLGTGPTRTDLFTGLRCRISLQRPLSADSIISVDLNIITPSHLVPTCHLEHLFMSMFLLPHYHKSYLCIGATRLPLSPYSVARRPRTAARGETRRPYYINTQLNPSLTKDIRSKFISLNVGNSIWDHFCCVGMVSDQLDSIQSIRRHLADRNSSYLITRNFMLSNFCKQRFIR